MKNTKKWLLFLLAGISCLNAFAACDSGNSSSLSSSSTSDGTSNSSVNEKEEQEITVDLKNEIDTNIVLGKIVDNGVSEYKIVSTTMPAAKYAATEMQLYIKQTTGVELEIVPDKNLSETGKYISIGTSSLYKKQNFDIPYEGLNGDGFIVKTIGDDLFINGASARANIFGVYDFIEKIMGVRFISQDYTYLPELQEIPLYKMDIVDAPAFELRNYYSYTTATSNQFALQCRLAAPEFNMSERFGGNVGWYTKFNAVHNAFYWVPDKYVDTNPELYAKNTFGTVERKSTPAPGSTYTGTKGFPAQLCLTNGMTEDGELDTTQEFTVASIALESLKSFILDEEDSDTYFYGNNDWQLSCKCSNCLAAERKYGGPSGVEMVFVNMLSDEIGKWMKEEKIDKDITLSAWAYLHTEDAPIKEVDGKMVPYHEAVVPRDNVVIRTAPIFLNWYYPIESEKQTHSSKTILEDWSVLKEDDMMIWTYEDTYGGLLWYTNTMRTWKENFALFKKHDLSYVMMQDNYNGHGSWQVEMRTYVGSKMLWNPNADQDALVEEFLYHYFGENGATVVRSFMDKMNERNAWLEENVASFSIYTPYSSGACRNMTEWYSKALMEECIQMFKAAITANNQDTSITGEMRNLYNKHLTQALIIPEFIVLSSYKKYYDDGDIGLNRFATEFFTHCTTAGVRMVAEWQSIEDYKKQFSL